MQGIPSRMEKHNLICKSKTRSNNDQESITQTSVEGEIIQPSSSQSKPNSGNGNTIFIADR